MAWYNSSYVPTYQYNAGSTRLVNQRVTSNRYCVENASEKSRVSQPVMLMNHGRSENVADRNTQVDHLPGEVLHVMDNARLVSLHKSSQYVSKKPPVHSLWPSSSVSINQSTGQLANNCPSLICSRRATLSSSDIYRTDAAKLDGRDCMKSLHRSLNRSSSVDISNEANDESSTHASYQELISNGNSADQIVEHCHSDWKSDVVNQPDNSHSQFPLPDQAASSELGSSCGEESCLVVRRRRRCPEINADADNEDKDRQMSTCVSRRLRRICRTSSSPVMNEKGVLVPSCVMSAPRRRNSLRLPSAHRSQNAFDGSVGRLVSTHEQLRAVCVSLHEPILHSLVNRVRLMGSRSLTVNQTDSSGRTPLSYLCCHGNARCVQKFAELRNVQVNLADREGNTPLHYAAQAGHSAVVTALIENFPELNLDARNNQGMTALHKACIQGKSHCAKVLIQHGADVSAVDKCRQLNCLQWALFCGRQNCARSLQALLLSPDVHRLSQAPGHPPLAVGPGAPLQRYGSAPDMSQSVASESSGDITGSSVIVSEKATNQKSRLSGKIWNLFRCVIAPSNFRHRSLLRTRSCSLGRISTGKNCKEQVESWQSSVPSISVQQVTVSSDPLVTKYGSPYVPNQSSGSQVKMSLLSTNNFPLLNPTSEHFLHTKKPCPYQEIHLEGKKQK